MKLDLKYNFGDEVYVVFKEDDEIVRVFKAKIVEFSMSEKYGLNYYVDSIGAEEFKEEELVSVDDPGGLLMRIDKLLGGKE